MHEHDLDLIAALADGSLEDESEARSLVESCEVCREEYRAQSEVLSLLVAMPSVGMTDLERAALHRELWTELRAEPQRRGIPLWQRWSYVAAGLFVAVGLVGALNAGLGGSTQGAETTSAELADTSADLAGSPASEEPRTFSGEDSAIDGGGETEGATTTAAAAESTVPPFTDLAAEVRSRRAEDETYTQSVDDDLEECLTQLGLDDQLVVDEVELDQRYLALMSEDPDDRTVTFVSVADCVVAHVDR